MKRLLLIAALTAAPAMADTFAMPNQAGGEIVITDRKCTDKDGRGLLEAYNYSSGGRMLQGCWTVIDGMVHVVWFDGTRYSYPIENFYKKSGGKKGTSL